MKPRIIRKKPRSKAVNSCAGEYVYGVHPVTEVLLQRKRTPLCIYSAHPEALPPAIAQRVREWKIPVRFAKTAELTRLCGNTDHQSIVASVKPFVYRSRPFEPSGQPFLVLLDGVQDVRNVGAIVRSAYCVGASGIVLPKKGSAPLNAVALKASVGLAERMAIMQPATALFAVQSLKKAGYQLIIASFGGVSIDQIEPQKPICLVIGSEGFGVSSAIVKLGTVCTLSQQADDVSYNASVAAGILLYTIATRMKLIP